jgi:predicted Zn-dependent peptidase
MRSLAKIDDELWIERGIWLHERRAGRTNPDCVAAMRRIDRLLDERTAHTTTGGPTHGETNQTHP